MRWGWGHCKFLAPTQGRQAVPPQICPCLSTAAIPGYQHTPDSLSARATQFYINKIDATNREHKLEDKGETRALENTIFILCVLWPGCQGCLAQCEPRCDRGPRLSSGSYIQHRTAELLSGTSSGL